MAARMVSDRLPGKVMKPVLGKPILTYIFDILKRVKNLDGFILITTVLEEDDVIEELCNKYKVDCVRGSVHDVIDRFRIAYELYRPEHIVRVTGDDPLMDPELIERIINEHLNGDFDYTSNIINRTYPR